MLCCMMPWGQLRNGHQFISLCWWLLATIFCLIYWLQYWLKDFQQKQWVKLILPPHMTPYSVFFSWDWSAVQSYSFSNFFYLIFFFFCYSTFSFFSWNKFILLIQRKLLQLHVIFDIFFKNSDQKWFRCFYFYFVTMNSISIAEKLNGFYCNIIDTPVVKRRVIKLEFFRRGFFHHQQNLLWYTLLHQSIKKKNRFVFMTKTKPVHYQIFLMSNTITLQKITSKFH